MVAERWEGGGRGKRRVGRVEEKKEEGGESSMS